MLQGEGRGGDDDPVAVEQRGDEVAQRLAGAGAGLHEQVPPPLHGVGDRLGHRHLPGTLLPAEPVHGGGEDVAHAHVRVSLLPLDHASTLRAVAGTGVHAW